MGKQAGHMRARKLRLAPLALATMLVAGECHADWRVHPTFSLTETFTDNVSLQAGEFKHSQFVTEFTPGLTLVGKGRRFQVAASGQWRQFAYSNGQQPGTADRVYEYSFNGRGELVKHLLFIEASASSSPQSISAFGQQVGSSLYSLGNRTQIKSWRISPYLEQRVGRSGLLTARYARDQIDADKYDVYGSSLADSISANFMSGSEREAYSWGLNYTRQDLKNKISGESSSETARGNLRYGLTPRLWLTATAGYDRYDYQALGGRTEGRSWSGGFDWTPSLRTRLSAEIGRHYFGKTGKLLALHRSRYTAWTITYDDFITTTRQQFLLPAAIDTAQLLDRLFTASITDPVLRQQAVAAYIQQTGLPQSLANSINYLSNRYLHEKRLQGSSAFTRGRSSAVLTLYRTERVALSSQESDSPLLGSQFFSLNDNVRQKGVSLSYNYRVNARTSALATTTASHSDSLTTGYATSNRELRLGVTHQLGKDMRAMVELRNLRGGLGPNAGMYRENAISASLSAQF